MADVPKLIAGRLLEGWCMLNKSCEKDLTPLLRARDGREVCVACEGSHGADAGESKVERLERDQRWGCAKNTAEDEHVEAPPPRCFLPEPCQPSQPSQPLQRKERSAPGTGLWEVLVQGPSLKFHCTRLAPFNNERPRLLADSFSVKVRLAAAVGVDTYQLQEAAALACQMLMHKILLPKLQGHELTTLTTAKGQVSITYDDQLIFIFPEEDCRMVSQRRVTAESLAGIIWEELGRSALKLGKRGTSNLLVSQTVSGSCPLSKW